MLYLYYNRGNYLKVLIEHQDISDKAVWLSAQEVALAQTLGIVSY